jgi:hypothetical protein
MPVVKPESRTHLHDLLNHPWITKSEGDYNPNLNSQPPQQNSSEMEDGHAEPIVIESVVVENTFQGGTRPKRPRIGNEVENTQDTPPFHSSMSALDSNVCSNASLSISNSTTEEEILPSSSSSSTGTIATVSGPISSVDPQKGERSSSTPSASVAF